MADDEPEAWTLDLLARPEAARTKEIIATGVAALANPDAEREEAANDAVAQVSGAVWACNAVGAADGPISGVEVDTYHAYFRSLHPGFTDTVVVAAQRYNESRYGGLEDWSGVLTEIGGMVRDPVLRRIAWGFAFLTAFSDGGSEEERSLLFDLSLLFGIPLRELQDQVRAMLGPYNPPETVAWVCGDLARMAAVRSAVGGGPAPAPADRPNVPAQPARPPHEWSTDFLADPEVRALVEAGARSVRARTRDATTPPTAFECVLRAGHLPAYMSRNALGFWLASIEWLTDGEVGERHAEPLVARDLDDVAATVREIGSVLRGTPLAPMALAFAVGSAAQTGRGSPPGLLEGLVDALGLPANTGR